jgi:transposase
MPEFEEDVSMNTITIGIDLAKSLFFARGVQAYGRLLQRQDLRRKAFGVRLAQVPTGAIVTREACSCAHA